VEAASIAFGAFGEESRDKPAELSNSSAQAPDEQSARGPTLAEPLAASSEAEQASARDDRIDAAKEEAVTASNPTQEQQPQAHSENGKEPATSSTRQCEADASKRNELSWADVVDDEKEDIEKSAKPEDDPKEDVEASEEPDKVVADETPTTAEESTAVEIAPEELRSEPPAPTNEQETSTAEVAPTSAPKKQWAKDEKESERTDEDPPPLPEQDWPTLANQGGKKRGKRK
jgi:hypothetical protein